MPTYDFHCNGCDSDFVWVSGMAQMDEAACPGCGAVKPDVERIFDKQTAPMVQADIIPYFDHGAGRKFNSRQERKDWMKAKGYEEVGNDPTYMGQCKELLQRCRDKKH